jgi:hypothetical protein
MESEEEIDFASFIEFVLPDAIFGNRRGAAGVFYAGRC